jgi:hypothetical protein
MEFFNNLWYIFTGYTNLILHIFGLKKFSAAKRFIFVRNVNMVKVLAVKNADVSLWQKYGQNIRLVQLIINPLVDVH